MCRPTRRRKESKLPDGAAEFYERFHEAINNDLNLPRALAVALELVAEAYRRKDFRGMADAARARRGARTRAREFFESAGAGGNAVTGTTFGNFDPERRGGAQGAQLLWLADQLRKELENRGDQVKDNRDGTATYQRRRALNRLRASAAFRTADLP